jgi:hypothetical protein
VALAVVVLARNTLRDLVLSASVFQTLGEGDADGNDVMEGLWNHSLACGVARDASRNGVATGSCDAPTRRAVHELERLSFARPIPSAFGR